MSRTDHKSEAAVETRARNKAALLLFGRTVVITWTVVSVAIGFFAGIVIQRSNFDPYAYASGVGALFAVSCAVIALLLMRRRVHKAVRRKLEAQIEELLDSNWELREAEERTRSFLEAQGDVIVRRDAQGTVTYANDAFCMLISKTHEEILGTRHELTPNQQGPVTVLNDGTRVHDQKIGARWIAWREVDVRGESGPEVQSVGRDVTDRVEAEHALALARDLAESANKAKSRFLATVSHEVRTPLNGLLGMTNLLLDTPLTPEQTSYAKAARSSGEALLSLIEEILDFSKIEAGRLDLDAQPFALAPMVEDLIELVAPRAQAKGIGIACYIDEAVPALVTGDAARVRQILLNLVGNAIKFTEQGGVAVVVQRAESGAVRFMVSDTGIGLKEQDLSRIFLEFEQADDSTTRKFGGTGLGLAITKRIVDRMNGFISVESTPGKGTTFMVTLPLPNAGIVEPSYVSPALDGKSALIVTSAPLEGELLARRLAEWGAKTRIANDAPSADALMKSQKWDMLLVDYAFATELTGIQTAALPDSRQTIVLIKPTDRHALPGLKKAGFNGYLVKPVRASSLAARLWHTDSFGDVAPEPAQADSAVAASDEHGLSILEAEANEIKALHARAMLTRMGHRPTIASDGAKAFDAWHAEQAGGTPFDLILMDLQMPHLDGLEAARRIRAAEAELGQRPTPILALTANAQAEDRDAALAAGMNGWLVKPLDRERLKEALDKTGLSDATLAA
jgi:signal transduction histidine kinase/DNA-binding response OmpR family regulator